MAIKYLSERKGYKLLGRNIHLRFGEVDALMFDAKTDENVVVEVRTRKSVGNVWDAISRSRMGRLKGLAKWFFAKYQKHCRVHIVLIVMSSEKKVIHIKNALVHF